jgi:hypothetical protein
VQRFVFRLRFSFLIGFFYTSFAIVQLCEAVSFCAVVLPESSQLDELISRVAASKVCFISPFIFPC